MASESNGRKVDSPESGSGSAPGSRSNARVATAWGAARDALTAVHNLALLLRAEGVTRKTILDLLAELRSGAGVLRAAFERSDGSDAAPSALRPYGAMRVGALDAMLDTIGEGHSDRTKLADRAEALAGELEAAVDLLALLDRAAAPAATEVSLDLIAREVGRVSVSGRGREVTVRFDEARPDCVIVTDPYVLGPLLALVVAFVDASGVDPLVLRARSSPRPCFVVEREGSADTSSPILTIRVMPWIPPSEEAARRAAQRLGAEIVLLPGHGEITLDSTSDD